MEGRTFSCRTKRGGLSLIEILIAMFLLAVGLISLAALFPVGLARLGRATDDTRGAVLARTARAISIAGPLYAPPWGAIANAYIADPVQPDGTVRDPVQQVEWVLVEGARPGIPVVIDPLGILENSTLATLPEYPCPDETRLGRLQDSQGQVLYHGLPRYRGYAIQRAQAQSGLAAARVLARSMFSAPDRLYWHPNYPYLPFQARLSQPAELVAYGSRAFLRPTSGPLYAPGTLPRKLRYTWFAIIQKTSQTFAPAYYDRVSNDSDSDAGEEWHLPGSDGEYGPAPQQEPPDQLTGLLPGLETDIPVGPFRVTIVAFRERDFQEPPVTVPFVFPVGPDGAPGRAGVDDDGNGITDFVFKPRVRSGRIDRGLIDWAELGWPGSDDAPANVLRIPIGNHGAFQPRATNEGLRIPKGSYVLDATYVNLGGRQEPPRDYSRAAAPRHAYVYRVAETVRVSDPNLGPVLWVVIEGDAEALWAGPWAATQGRGGLGALVLLPRAVMAYQTIVGGR